MDLPSQHQLIPHLGVLDRLLLEKTPAGRAPATQREMELLPYYLRGACAGISQLERARVEAVKVLANPTMGPHTRVILSPDQVDPLAYAIDFYLFCVRRTFDALVSYLRRCPTNLSLPASLHDVVDGIRTGKHRLDSQLQDTVLAFWDDMGFRIKGYRDQANHQGIILSNCIAFNASGRAGLRMLLPDDPKEKRPSEMRYNPGVPAMGFALDSLQKTIRFVNALVERMIDLMAPSDPNARNYGVVGPAIRGAPLAMSPTISGEPVPFPLGVTDVVANATRTK